MIELYIYRGQVFTVGSPDYGWLIHRGLCINRIYTIFNAIRLQLDRRPSIPSPLHRVPG